MYNSTKLTKEQNNNMQSSTWVSKLGRSPDGATGERINSSGNGKMFCNYKM